MITLEPYQTTAAMFLRTRKRAAVISPAGSGKTIIAAAALHSVLISRERLERVKIGWLANTREQCDQARAALEHFPQIAKRADVQIECAAAATDWSGCAALVVDEAHHAASAPGWLAQIQTCAGVVWGLTATPPESAETVIAFNQLFPEVHTVERAEVKSRLAAARVQMLTDTDPDLRSQIDVEIQDTLRYRRRFWRGSEQELWGQVAWQVCIKLGIIANQQRNIAAIRAARYHQAHGGSVLMLVNQVEHAQGLAEAVNGVACFAKMGAKKRAAALEAFKAGELKCIVATSLADEGLDVPRANVLVLVSGGRSRARAEQRTGRVLRAFAGKVEGLIYDFEDTWHPLAAKHSRARVELYQELGYKVEGIK